eukprot:gene5952-6191_t
MLGVPPSMAQMLGVFIKAAVDMAGWTNPSVQDGMWQPSQTRPGIMLAVVASARNVVVIITDTCPCIYPDNYSSNKRWCCGDMYHLDMSVWAYEKLGSKKWGVIGVSWRDVPCWYKPKAKARVPWWTKPTPQPWWEKAPQNWKPAMDQRLRNRFKFQNGKKH